MDDRALVEQQLGRPPRAFRRVAARCPDGSPAVTEQWPYDDAGDPFPTTYYLTCPYLVAAIARLEAAGGVERWSEEVERDAALAADLERATEEQRRIRRELAGGKVGPDGGSSLELGIGGSANPRRLKCLHAHAAYALAQPGYLLGERILDELDPRWPQQCCLGGIGETSAESLGRAALPEAASSVAPIASAIGAPCVLASERATRPTDERRSTNPS